jgi:hypothetical protein
MDAYCSLELRSGRVTGFRQVVNRSGWGAWGGSTIHYSKPSYTFTKPVNSYKSAMKSLLARSRTQVKPTVLKNALPAASRTLKPPTQTRQVIRAYHAHPSISSVSTVIDPSTFPITKGYTPPVNGKPHFKKVLIANRYVPHLF